MLDFEGLSILIDLLTSSDHKYSAADSLLSLAYGLRALTFEDDPLSPQTPEPNHVKLDCPHSGLGCKPRCRYRDHDHAPFDYTVTLDLGHQAEGKQVQLLAHRGILMEACEVFNVMLGGHFLESRESEVYLRDVHPGAFLCLLHHIYGCGWKCREVKETWFSEDGSHDDCSHDNHNDASSSLISAVVANYDGCAPSEIVRALCCLETASRFLMEELTEACEKEVAEYFTTETLIPIFLFSRLHVCYQLAEDCVRFLLYHTIPSSSSRACLLQLVSCSESYTARFLIRIFISVRLL